MKKSVLDIFIEKLKNLPLWIKQVVFLHLYQDLSEIISDDFLRQKKEDLLHLYVPVMSYIGKTELEERAKGLEPNVYSFLESLDEGRSIMEIAMIKFWTLNEVCKYFLTAVDADLIKAPVPPKIIAMAGFMAGRYRTGEYFKRIGKINVDQLELIIRRHKELSANGEKVKFGDVMIELGYVTRKDTESLVRIKEEANKRFILDPSIVPDKIKVEDNKYLAEIDSLKKQNYVLKAKLTKLLSMFKKK